MNTPYKLSLCLVLVTLLGACAPKLDTSSPKAFLDSQKKIEESLPEEKKGAFSGAIMTIFQCTNNRMLKEVDAAAKAIMSGGNYDLEAMSKKYEEIFHTIMHDKTADEIIALAEEIKSSETSCPKP
jgi:hypothetical protein